MSDRSQVVTKVQDKAGRSGGVCCTLPGEEAEGSEGFLWRVEEASQLQAQSPLWDLGLSPCDISLQDQYGMEQSVQGSLE